MYVILFLPSILAILGLTGLGIMPVVGPASVPPKTAVSINVINPFPPPTPTSTPTQTPTPTPSPTPKPLTFAQMNALWGPCVYVPVLFWHHIQDEKVARQEGHAALTVDTAIFRSQMQYLKDHGYTTIRPEELIAFFDAGAPLPPKPVLLTVDDGYDDFASDAAPIIREFGFQATSFLPTGLLNNPGFMTWDTVTGLSGSGNFYFGNHTWSHRNVSASRNIDEIEITTADTQLSQHGLNLAKVFAYPYGNPTSYAITILQNLGYKLAFTSYGGGIQCKSERLTLPRMRIGNTSLSAYGL